MTPAHVAAIIAELGAYRRGERDGRLTWKKIVQFSGFSHVSLWKRKEICEAFRSARAALRKDATPTINKRRTPDERAAQLLLKIDGLKAVIQTYDELWVRYEYNMHRLGLDPEELRRPLDGLAREIVRSKSVRRIR